MKRYLVALFALALLVGVAAADVVLTIPEAVRSEVGGAATVSYDRIRTLSVSVSPVDNTLDMSFELFVSTDAARPPYRGTYRVRADDNTASISIPGLSFETGITLTAGQATAAVNAINAHVAQVEGSLVSFGVVDGVQQ